jgi:O-antigen ligase
MPREFRSKAQTERRKSRSFSDRYFAFLTLRSVQLWTTSVALASAPLFFGSVDLVWVVCWTIALAIAAGCGAGFELNVQQTRIFRGALGVFLCYAVVSVIQILPLGLNNLNDPSWHRLNELLELSVGPRISSREKIPDIAIGHFFTFVFAFTNGFLLGTSRENSATLIKVARISILAYAGYGLFALVFTPTTTLWATKSAYLGSFTTTFINHNTAGTLVGSGLILWASCAVSSWQAIRTSSVRLLLLNPANEKLSFDVLFKTVGALVCFFALLSSGSRGALISSCAGLLTLALLIVGGRDKVSRKGLFFFALTGAVASIGWLLQIGRIASQGLVDEQRWSVYELCLQSVQRRPWFGSGAGTFEDIFPSLRSPTFPSSGVWDHAHSTILEIAVEMGIPVAVIIGLAALATVLLLSRAAMQQSISVAAPLAAIAGVAVLSYVHSLVDFSLQIPGYFIPFGILMGLGLARAASSPISDGRRRGQSSNAFAFDPD